MFHKKKKALFLLALAPASLAVLGLGQVGQNPGQLPNPSTPLPTIRPPAQTHPVQARLRPAEHAAHSLSATLRVATAARKVSIDWGWEDDWGSTGRSSQGFDLSFYPTAAVRIDGGLILAGIRATDGNTVIERWSVTYPAPGAAGSSYAATVTAVETLLDASVPGRKGVRLMCVLQRAELAPTSVLVQFNDSNALHVLDITDGTLELLWDTTAVPALANPDWLFIWSADHPSHGHLYLWQPFQGQEEFSTLVGFDADRDGTLDVWGLLDEASFEALLGSPATWTKTFE